MSPQDHDAPMDAPMDGSGGRTAERLAQQAGPWAQQAGPWAQRAGCFLLGLYFLGPGVLKLFNLPFYEGYMAAHGVPLVTPLLWLTIALQVIGGASLMAGYRRQLVAFVLAGLTLVINVYMHDFWNVYEGLNVQHEQQNFVKNLGIFAGLLYIAGSRPG